MSRSFRQAVVCTLALAVVVVAANTSSAGCGSGRYRGNFGGHYRHYTSYRAPVVHRVVRPVVHVAPRVVVVAPPIAPAPVVAPKPIPAPAQLPSVPAGSTLSLPGNFLGPVAGHVFLVLNEIKLPAQIVSWNPNGVTVTLPPMAVKQSSPARLDVIMPQGRVINKVKILLTPPAPLVLHPTSPASPLPTGPAPAPVQAGEPQVGGPFVLSSQQ